MKPARSLWAYGGAALAVAVAVGLRLLAEPWIDGRLPFLTVFGAVALTVWFGGWRPAVLAAALGFVAASTLIPGHPAASGIPDAAYAVALFGYAAICAGIIAFGVTIKRAQRRLEREVAERKDAEALAVANEARVRLATDAAELGLWVWDTATGRVTWENDRLHAMLGVPAGAAPVDAEEFRDAFLHPDDAPAFEKAVRATLGSGARFHFEGRFRRRSDGALRWIELTGLGASDAEGRRQHVMGTAADITERKQADEALRTLAADLSEADRRKTEFLATLAHELRSPLAPLRNGLHLLRLAEHEPQRLADVRGMMERQLSHLVHLVDDLLDVARISRGKIHLRTRRVDLEAIVRTAVETATPAIEARGHRLILDLAEGLPALDADADRIAQVIGNLLVNAAKYTPPDGRIALSTRREDDRLVLSVTDNGLGLAAESLDTMFDLFTQVGRAPDTPQGGLGIGLALVRQLVELHGGSVRATSPGLGLGSTLEVRLPHAGVAAVPVDSAAPEVLAGPGAEPLLVRSARILVVDDSVDAAQSLAAVLQGDGHVVDTANDGVEALAKAGAFQPDIVFLDIGMPRKNGYEVAAALRSEPAFVDTVLIALTGWGADQDKLQARRVGFDAHLTKPADLDEVRTLVSRFVGSEEGRERVTRDWPARRDSNPRPVA